MLTLSPLQARVYFTIRKYGAMGPTRIGGHLEFDYEVAAPSVTRPLKGLVKMGLLKRIELNKRVVHYHCAHAIDPPMRIDAKASEMGDDESWLKEINDANR